MPRTKRVQALKCVEPKESQVRNRQEILDVLQKEEEKMMASIDQQMEKELNELKLLSVRIKTKYPLHMLNRTIREITSGELESTVNSTKSFKKNQTLSSTRANTRKRSTSLCCDEGYTTAESSRGTSGDRTVRQSRAKTKSVSKPISRSLSRNTAKKAPFVTPANKQRSFETGSITPKCKPNIPQIIVRRPKVGEMAWSNQGSPLLTTHTISAENVANVNIPLPGGNLVSILPQRGVRVSQIPEIDAETRRQLFILRDNLIKVCDVHEES